MAKIKGVKPLVQNRRARHEYFVEGASNAALSARDGG